MRGVLRKAATVAGVLIVLDAIGWLLLGAFGPSLLYWIQGNLAVIAR